MFGRAVSRVIVNRPRLIILLLIVSLSSLVLYLSSQPQYPRTTCVDDLQEHLSWHWEGAIWESDPHTCRWLERHL